MTALRPRDIFLAVLVVFVFGVSFVAVKLGLQSMSPLALSAWRFLLAAVPLVLLVPRPPAPPLVLFGYGFCIGVLQFGLLFSAIALGMPAGLTSLIIQVLVFFTIGLSAWLFREHVGRAPLAGALVAAAGLVVIGITKVTGGLGWLPFLLVLAAGLAWACGNLISKRAGRIEPLAFIGWTSLAAPLPLAALSLLFEPRDALLFGMGSTALVFGETLTAWQTVGVMLVIGGLALVVFGPRLERGFLRDRRWSWQRRSTI